MRKRKLGRLRNELAEALAAETHEIADERHTLDGTDEMISAETALKIADDFIVLAGMGPIARLRTTLPFSRPCYDKPHRCPGWAGGAWIGARVYRCKNGSLSQIGYRRRYWLGARCPECGLYVLPIVSRWLDPTWIWWAVRHPRCPMWTYWLNPRYARARWRNR